LEKLTKNGASACGKKEKEKNADEWEEGLRFKTKKNGGVKTASMERGTGWGRMGGNGMVTTEQKQRNRAGKK